MKKSNWHLFSFMDYVEPLSRKRPTKNNIAQGEKKIQVMVIDWSANRNIKKLHIHFFDKLSVALKGNLDDANVFIIRKLI